MLLCLLFASPLSFGSYRSWIAGVIFCLSEAAQVLQISVEPFCRLGKMIQRNFLLSHSQSPGNGLERLVSQGLLNFIETLIEEVVAVPLLRSSAKRKQRKCSTVSPVLLYQMRER